MLDETDYGINEPIEGANNEQIVDVMVGRVRSRMLKVR